MASSSFYILNTNKQKKKKILTLNIEIYYNFEAKEFYYAQNSSILNFVTNYLIDQKKIDFH